MKKLLFLALMVLIATSATAQTITYTFGWEDGTSTVIGGYSDFIATNVTSPVYGGNYALEFMDNTPDGGGTPQGYICWIRGLQDGDEVYASVARFDDTPGASPSGRIWGHWNDDPLDIGGYAGSASGNSDYGEGLGWDITDWTWLVLDGHTGLMIECRIYSNPGDTVWYDNLTVTVPDRDGIEVEFPGGYVPVFDGTMSQLKALY
jgi:hypothetical protein